MDLSEDKLIKGFKLCFNSINYDLTNIMVEHKYVPEIMLGVNRLNGVKGKTYSTYDNPIIYNSWYFIRNLSKLFMVRLVYSKTLIYGEVGYYYKIFGNENNIAIFKAFINAFNTLIFYIKKVKYLNDFDIINICKRLQSYLSNVQYNKNSYKKLVKVTDKMMLNFVNVEYKTFDKIKPPKRPYPESGKPI